MIKQASTSTRPEPGAPVSGGAVTRPAPATGVVRRLLAFAAPDRPRFAAAVALGMLAVISVVLLLAASAWLISAAALQPPLIVLSLAIVAVRAFALGRAVFRYLERLVSHDAAFRLLARLRVRFYAHLEPLAPAGLPEFRRGDLLARLVDDVDAVQDLSLRVLQPVAVAAAAAAAAVGLVAMLLPSAALVLLSALLVAALAVPAVTAWAGRRADSRLAGARAELSCEVVDLLRAMPDLVAFGAADHHLARIDTRDARAHPDRPPLGDRHRSGGRADCTLLRSGGLGLPGRRGARRSRRPARRRCAGRRRVDPARGLRGRAAAADRAARARPRPKQRRACSRRSRPTRAGAGARAAQPLPTEAPLSLRLRGACARWPDAAPDAPASIADIDLDLGPGRRVAVVGASGAGKTTLAALLVRFVDLTAGSYCLGGHDVRTAAGDEVRRVVGLCAQDAHVFDSTVRENLRLARPGCDDATLRDALHRVRLLDWVDGLADGLDTHVGERGVRMSAGERQRLILARALLADFPVLVLDEPTANLDPPPPPRSPTTCWRPPTADHSC